MGNASRMIRLLGSIALGAVPCLIQASGATWTLETVDQSGVGKFTSLKVDRNGNAHLAYVIDDGNRYPLRYAIRDHKTGKWFLMTLAESVGSCSLVLDSKQNPHISYVDAGTGVGSKVHYTYWNGTTWKNVPIQLNSEVISYYSSLVLDKNDQPSITFYEYRGAKDSNFSIRLRNVTLRDGAWQVKTVDFQEGSGKFNAMAIDSRGHMHIAYANVAATTAGARYALWDGQRWTTEVLEGLSENRGQMVGYSSAIAIDKDEDPHVTYVNESDPMLKYAVRKNGKWQIEAVTKMLNVAYPDRNSIGLDDNNQPYISYYDAGHGTLILAHKVDQIWMLETIDNNGAGFTSSLAIHDGQIWISYADETNRGVKVARRDLELKPPPTETKPNNVSPAGRPE